MALNKNKNKESRDLKTRYLIWLYKTTKEQLDRIDRKFRQLEIDKFILKKIEAELRLMPHLQKQSFKRHLKNSLDYIKNKESDAFRLKFNKAGVINPEYQFLKVKLWAIENAIKKHMGKRLLTKIKALYQQEMIRRILREEEHK